MKLTVKEKLNIARTLSNKDHKQCDMELLKQYASKSRLLTRPFGKIEASEVIYALLNHITQDEILENRPKDKTVIEASKEIIQEVSQGIVSTFDKVKEKVKKKVDKMNIPIFHGVSGEKRRLKLLTQSTKID